MKNFDWQFPQTPEAIASLFGHTVTGSQINSKIAEFVGRSVILNSDPKHLGALPASKFPAKDVHEFGEILAFAVQMKQVNQGIDINNRIEVRQKYSDLNIERDVITWNVKSRTPGLMSRGAARDKGTQDVTKHLRAVYEDVENPGSAILAYSQAIDNEIELCVYSADAQAANDRAIWLENVLDEMQWLFKYYGFERFYFVERKEDCFEDKGSNRLHCRPLIYFLRVHKITLYRESLLRKLTLELSVASPGNDPRDYSPLIKTEIKQ